MVAHCHCGSPEQLSPARMGVSSSVPALMGNQRCLYSGGEGHSSGNKTSSTGEEGRDEIFQSMDWWMGDCSAANGTGAPYALCNFWRRGWLTMFALTYKCSGWLILYSTRSGIALSATNTMSSSKN